MCVCVLIVIDDKSLSSQSLLKSESISFVVCGVLISGGVCKFVWKRDDTQKQNRRCSRELKTTLTTNDLKQIHTHQKHVKTDDICQKKL